MSESMLGKVICKTCRTVQDRIASDHPAGRAPVGWLSLSVSVPPWVTTGSGHPYLWVGVYCSVACLQADGDRLAAEEQLAGWKDTA